MAERIDLEYFLDAYKQVTGKKLSIVNDGERPDFICRQPNGLKVGIELTKVMRDPESAFWDSTFYRQQYMSVTDALDNIYLVIERKEGERKKADWSYANNTILVLQLTDCPITDLEWFIDYSLQSDFSSHGFVEVWLADYTGSKAFGDIELFGIYPPERWGYYQRQNPYRKPYG